MIPENYDQHRYPVYSQDDFKPEPEVSELPRKSRLSYLTFFILLILWPVLSIPFAGDPMELLKQMAVSRILFVYMPNIVIQWLIFTLIFVTAYREGTGLKGIGFNRIRLIHFFWAIAFLLFSNLILSLLALLLSQVNIAIPGELGIILPETNTERALWVILSLTAGVCEETAFRGYLITRIKQFGRLKSWLIPITVSSVFFGSGHAYQGVGGLILLGIYGVMFAVLYIRAGSIWPCIIAHFFQDFSALFYPYQR
ncbi:MAG: type II CAAX endopeptidase family protein [Candidatus Zixiibacteriota bacterium]